VHDLSQKLFQGASATGALVDSDEKLAEAIAKKLAPDVKIDGGNGEVGFIHRHTDTGEVYFVANTSNQPRNVKAMFRVANLKPEIWDPMSGNVSAAAAESSAGATTVNLSLEPYGSTFVAFTNRSLPAQPGVTAQFSPFDLSSGWTVKFGSSGPTINMDKLQSWAENDQTKAFSGVATYTRQFIIDPPMLTSGAKVMLTLGQTNSPQVNQGGGRGGNGFRTTIETPVRDAAVVYVNDKRIGSVWSPPYSIDVSSALKVGENRIRIEVGNLAVNYMAAHGYPNYNLQGIRQVYGNRFDPQGLNNLQPMPSGLLGPIKLEAAK
jgi:hypothetical protein